MHNSRMRKSALDWIVPESNPGGVVYGLILVGALLAAESGLRESYLATFASAAITIVLYWFAHTYADILGLRLSERHRPTLLELWLAFVEDWAIVRGAGVPLLAMVAAWAFGAAQSTAVTVGTWTAVVGLVAFELAAGLRSRAGRLELALEVVAGATMGIAILVLRAVLH
jgi:hypothetical protein